MKNLVLFVVLCIGFVSCTKVNQCKSGLDLPLEVLIKNCDEPPCELARGSLAVINITFEAPLDIEVLVPKINVKALGIDIPDYPLEEKDGCKSLVGDSCPLEEGQIVLFSTAMDVKRIFPPIKVNLELTLYSEDEDGELSPFTCIDFDVQVK